MIFPEAEEHWAGESLLSEPIFRLNATRRAAGALELRIERPDRKSINFVRKADSGSFPLHAYIAEWFSEYLIEHRSFVDLGVCVECARLFVRERRDNLYCSRTCQNRVAYKRRRIFEAGVLREIASQPAALQPGICVHHHRLGLGIVEAVRIRRYIDPGKNWLGLIPRFEIGEGQTMEQRIEELKGDRRFSVADNAGAQWREVRDPKSLNVTVRFLHTIRDFAYPELFQKGDLTNRPTFYAIEDARKLAELM